MELIVLSTPGYWQDSSIKEEVEQVNSLFSHGLEHFHLRKPMFSVRELTTWLSALEPKYLSRVSLHSFHDLVYNFPVGGIHTSEERRMGSLPVRQQDDFLCQQFPQLRLSSSFHDLSDLRFAPKAYEYTFISPVFDSISKPHYRASFSRSELQETISVSRNKVIALGGVSVERLEDISQMGFAGAGLLGTLWKSENVLESFLECQREVARIIDGESQVRAANL